LSALLGRETTVPGVETMKAAPGLGRRELEIMNVVWQLDEATVRQVWQRLGSPAYTTVLTMMRALEEKKKILTHRERGKAYVYRATITREAVSRSLIGDLRDLVFGGSMPLLVHNLLGTQSLSHDELGQLRQVLDAHEEKSLA